MDSNPSHPTPEHTDVRSVLFFALVYSLGYQEGKLIADACAYWQVQKCFSKERASFKWTIEGSLGGSEEGEATWLS